MRIATILMLLLLATGALAYADSPFPEDGSDINWGAVANDLGSLLNPGIAEDNNLFLLPWYPVADWELRTCMQGLTSMETYEQPERAAQDVTQVIPIYMDTYSITAKKQEHINRTYYVVGWYLQPFQGRYNATITAYTDENKYVIHEGEASDGGSYSKYAVMPMPCTEEFEQEFRNEQTTICIPEAGDETVKRFEMRWWPEDDAEAVSRMWAIP